MADAPAAEPTPSPSGTPVEPVPVTPAVVAPEAKPPEVKEPDKPAEPAKPVVPEKYDYSALKLPEGVVINDRLLSAVDPVFRKYGLTQEAANEIVDTHSKALAAEEVHREADFKSWMNSQITQHQATLKKELGTRYDETVSLAKSGIGSWTRVDEFFTEADKARVLEILDQTGLGNEPAFVKMFSRAGKVSSEDMKLPGSSAPASRKPLERVLYPNMPPASTN